MFCEGTGRKDKERKRSNNKKMGGTDQQNTDKTHRFNVKMIGISFDFSSFYVFFFYCYYYQHQRERYLTNKYFTIGSIQQYILY